MKLATGSHKTTERRATVVAGLILVQAICAFFFMGDVIEDLLEDGRFDSPHLVLETIAAVGLISVVVLLMVELRGLLSRMSHMQTGLDVARGHLAVVIEGFFDEWKLTGAERDVAVMILKGLDNETIARLRKTAPGTVRAQATHVYSKSATSGRAQFISLFMEELMAGDIGVDSRTDHLTPGGAGNPPAAEELPGSRETA